MNFLMVFPAERILAGSTFTPHEAIPASHEIRAGSWAVPLRASLYYALPVGGRWGVDIHAGAAYYLACARADYLRDWGGYWEEDSYDLKAGGLGLEFRINRWAAVFMEGQARYERIYFSAALVCRCVIASIIPSSPCEEV